MKLDIEILERRDLLTATVVWTGGVLAITSDNHDNYLVASTPAAGVTEIFDAVAKTTQDFTGVASIQFAAGRGNNTFYNNTSLPSVQQAGNGPSTYVLVGGTGNDTLLGGSNPASQLFEQDPAGSNVLMGGAGNNNLFGGSGNDTILAAGKHDEVYDILGTNTVSGNGKGYLIVNAQSTTQAGPDETVITFFQTFTNKAAAVLQADVNGHGILYLNPQTPTGVSYTINQQGEGAHALLLVNYTDANGTQNFTFPKSQVDWLASFGTPGNDSWTNNTDVNDVFYGAAGDDTLIGGFGIDVLKGHGGVNGDTVVGRGRYNDLSVGPGGNGLLDADTKGFTIFRNNTTTVSTNDQDVSRQDVVIGVPLTFNGTADPNDRDTKADNDDFAVLAQALRTKDD